MNSRSTAYSGTWHFISILGTSHYQKTHYYFEEEKNGKTEREVIEATPYIQDALLTHFKDELSRDGSRATIFVTKESYDRNWQDHPISQQRKADDNAGADDRSLAVPEEKGLYTILKEKFPQDIGKISEKEIPVGKNRDELWEIFDNVYNDIETGENLVFDITHGLRSLPVLALAVLNYAATMKKCRIAGIYYGAFESADKDDKSNKNKDDYYLVPVFNLTLYNEILRWSHAADYLISTGNPAEINSLLREHARTCPDNNKKLWKFLSDYTHAMSNLSETLVMCRGKSLPNEKKYFKQSISSAFQKVQQIRKDNSALANVPNEERPFYQLVAKAEQSFSGFDETENYKIGLAAVNWYLAKNMIQPGYTALEETAKTYVCHHFHLQDDQEQFRDRIAGTAINKMSHYMQNKSLSPGNATKEDRDEICASVLTEEKAREIMAKILDVIMNDMPSDVTEEDIDNIFWSTMNVVSRYACRDAHNSDGTVNSEELCGTDSSDEYFKSTMGEIVRVVSGFKNDETMISGNDIALNLMNLMSRYQMDYCEKLSNSKSANKNDAECSQDKRIMKALKNLYGSNKDAIENIRQMKQVIQGLPFEYAKLVHDIKDFRNDLNHFGFNNQPSNADTFVNSLKKQYQSLVQLIHQMEGIDE